MLGDLVWVLGPGLLVVATLGVVLLWAWSRFEL